jgi:hypothetical protein
MEMQHNPESLLGKGKSDYNRTSLHRESSHQKQTNKQKMWALITLANVAMVWAVKEEGKF